MTLSDTIMEQLEAVRQASRNIVTLSDQNINKVLEDLAGRITSSAQAILEANRKDLEKMERSNPMYDRLLLDEKRLEGIAADMRNVASLPSPLDITLEERTLSSGLSLRKASVPIGVIGIIYEARPNVTFDVFALCLKSGNATVLKGGSDADHSNRAIAELIHTVLQDHGISPDILYLLPSEREAATIMMEAVGKIDMIIPRGSQQLIDHVRNTAKVPVIETGAGIVHTYVDRDADMEMAKAIVLNAKTRRPSVCNALDTLIIHSDRLGDLAELCRPLSEHQVIIFADKRSYLELLPSYPATLLKHAEPEHYGTEFLSLKMSVKTVDTLDEALSHIATYSSRHSEALITRDNAVKAEFFKRVDAAVVYHNASTAFTDGAQFGLGAEIGISTQKLHARGPMALKELTTYKWMIEGDGQTRPL
uniref:Gamma-glutamyl phosphate reductase n=2 Tax=Pelodictyon luteolum TaxID=1100 RepID=PROA_CHLL3|nr:RecName: Full=Gamma-glutamyl phosphate reductase; Short=GPR; AltName: Full=Glutamate-5-semialdehyde dehydrogenase; AltName: Full=Glutamyl-gamma-semialdehyde dehydrogenase; Short=GSA dehydrogenase [Pelodictyon luteolum DSM 273]